MSIPTCMCACVPSDAWSWLGLTLCLVQSDNSDVCPSGLHYCSDLSMRIFYLHVCAFAAELVFVRVPAASLLTGNAGNASGSDPTPCPACPAQTRGTLMGSDGGPSRGRGWG